MAKTKRTATPAGPKRVATGAPKKPSTPKATSTASPGLAVKIGRALSQMLRGTAAPKAKPSRPAPRAPAKPKTTPSPAQRKSSSKDGLQPATAKVLGLPETRTPTAQPNGRQPKPVNKGAQPPPRPSQERRTNPIPLNRQGQPKDDGGANSGVRSTQIHRAQPSPPSISDEGSPWRRGLEGREEPGVRPPTAQQNADAPSPPPHPLRSIPAARGDAVSPVSSEDNCVSTTPPPTQRVDVPSGQNSEGAEFDEPALVDETPLADAKLPRPRLFGTARRYASIIEQTLAEFGAPVQIVHAEVGPMLIRFGIVPGYLEKPARGDQPPRRERVRAAKVVSRSDDLALALGVTSLRIEAPVPGKTYIGVEVPNPHPKPVPLAPLLDGPEFAALGERGVLPLALGCDVAGHPILSDLARLPHLLIAGATGAGKSVAVNSLLGTLLRTRTRDDVRLIVVDPKRVEFTWLEDVPHMLAPVVTDPEQAVEVLGKVETEMAHRYDVLAAAGCRNRLAYNSRPGASSRAPLPALVVVIDELADLMMLASEDVERSICRVAQLGRAAGIHLVVATQRPSVDVITGLIKANLPARLAFAVSSLVDSRTILDAPGAERLLGRGDFLFLAPDAMRPVRGQGAMAKDSWLKQTVRAARDAVPADTPDPEAERFAKLQSATQIADDRLYARARELAQEHPKVSASFLQRRLRVGYPKAEALVERLRADGVIADPDLDDE
jgi:S-DNA-T family DNA segregation ATPase FtsK/SpoIIIE